MFTSEIIECRNCGERKLDMILDLGAQPPSNSFLAQKDISKKEKKYPLKLLYCTSCNLLQLSYTVDPGEMFTDYVYLSSTSLSLREHLFGLARHLYDYVKPQKGDLVVDIGCNDGALLNGYEVYNVRRLGIEPSSVAEIAREQGLKVHQDFFTEKAARDVFNKYGSAKIISGTNVFAHVADQDDFLKGVNNLLQDDGVFVIEVPHILDMLKDNLFDTIYHEHIFYFSIIALINLLERRGFRIFRIEKLSFGPSGPPIRVFICKQHAAFEDELSVDRYLDEEKHERLFDKITYTNFEKKVWIVKTKLLNIFENIKSRGEKIIGYGAPAKGNTILNTFGIGREWLDVILEKNNLKIGLVTPGTHIPIVNEDTYDISSYPYALLLSWNLMDEFLKRSPFIKNGGKFIVPLPQPKIVPS